MSDTKNHFKDSSNLTKWVKYFLYAQIGIAITSMCSNYFEYQLLSDFQSGAYISKEQAIADGEASDQRQKILTHVYIAVHVFSGFLILRWIHRANYNAHQLGAIGMKFTPGWSIGYYFIPILNLWKPYQAMEEIWKASHRPDCWTSEEAGSILLYWWFFWILTTLIGRVVIQQSRGAENIQDLMNVNIFTQVSHAFAITLALVTLSIVHSIYKAQSTAYKSINK